MYSKNFYIKFFIGFFLCSTFIIYTLQTMPYRHGDGHEYSLISKSFFNHLTPDLRIQDIVSREKDIAEYPSIGYEKFFFDDYKNEISKGKNESLGVYKAKDGKYYGYHFWFYSFLVSIIERITQLFSINPLMSFQITNALLISATVFFCLFVRAPKNISTTNRVLSVFIFILSGVVFYLKWSHPEVLIASFLFLSFFSLFIEKRNYAWLFGGLAGVQVISLWTIFLIFFIEYIMKNPDNKKGIYKYTSIFLKPTFLISAVLPSCSAVFYFYNYNKISLIGDSYIDINLISISHLLSFWFDIDQGAFVGAPIILVYIFICNINNRTNKFEFFLACLGALLICVPLLSQISVNSGQSVFMRYGLYAIQPLAAWSAFKADRVKQIIIHFIIICFGFSLVYYLSSDDEDYLKHKPWTNVILEHFPNIYNPEPGIFFARSNHWEWRSQYDYPAFFVNKKNFITKLLIPYNHMADSLDKICTGDIVDINGNKIQPNSYTYNRYEWLMFDGKYHCTGNLHLPQQSRILNNHDSNINNGILFNSTTFPQYVKNTFGLSGAEKWGRWSDGPAVGFKINVNKEISHISLIMGAYGENINALTTIECNNIKQKVRIFSYEPQRYIIDCKLNPNNKNWIVIYPPHPFKPVDKGYSSDTRQLGVSLVKMDFIAK